MSGRSFCRYVGLTGFGDGERRWFGWRAGRLRGGGQGQAALVAEEVRSQGCGQHLALCPPAPRLRRRRAVRRLVLIINPLITKTFVRPHPLNIVGSTGGHPLLVGSTDPATGQRFKETVPFWRMASWTSIVTSIIKFALVLGNKLLLKKFGFGRNATVCCKPGGSESPRGLALSRGRRDRQRVAAGIEWHYTREATRNVFTLVTSGFVITGSTLPVLLCVPPSPASLHCSFERWQSLCSTFCRKKKRDFHLQISQDRNTRNFTKRKLGLNTRGRRLHLLNFQCSV